MSRVAWLLAALGAVALWIGAVTTASARTGNGGNGVPAARAAAGPVVPTDGATYDAGTDFQLPCTVPTPRPDVHAVISTLERADPRTPQSEGFGVYPTFSSGWANPRPDLPPPSGVWPAITQVAQNFYQGVGPIGQTWTCKPTDMHADGTQVAEPDFTLWTPGFYHMVELDVSEHHQPITAPPRPPDTATCTNDIGGTPYLSQIGNWDDGSTMVVGHCRQYINVYFTVVASGDCSGLSKPYVGAPYINQYDWGRQAGGPPVDDHHDPGGNACGSSSLNMMLGNATPQVSLYNVTAHLPVGNGNNNYFDFDKALTALRSMGYKNARKITDFGGTVDFRGVASENDLSDWLKQGPVLTSTQFGAGEWSTAGGGHVILVLRKVPAQGAGESDGDYVVEDPAGGYFSDPLTNHYGAGHCGHQARYPVSWVAQLTLNRWGILLGKKSKPSADTARARSTSHTGVLVELPSGVNAWVQDRAGHRAGFVGGNQTVGLSGITLDDAAQAPSDPKAPYVSTAALAPAPSISLLDPGKGLTLVASGRRGQRITARMFVYRNGKLIKTVTVRAVLRSGVTRLLALPSVPGGKTSPMAQLNLTAKAGPGLAPGLTGLSVSARAPFAGIVSVTVTQGGKTVGAGATGVKAGAFTVPVFLFPGTTGRVTVTATLAGGGRRITGQTTATV